MTTMQESTGISKRSRQPEVRPWLTASSSSIEALLGAGAALFAILGLVHIAPLVMAALAVMAAGASLIMDGAAIANRCQRVLTQSNRTEVAELTGGISIELMAGAAGIVLGLLALLGLAPLSLLSVSAMAFGAALLLGAAASSELDTMLSHLEVRSHTNEVAHRAVLASGGARALIGMGGVVLGILSLTEVGPALTLILVAMLSIGAGLLLGGAALGSRVAAAMH